MAYPESPNSFPAVEHYDLHQEAIQSYFRERTDELGHAACTAEYATFPDRVARNLVHSLRMYVLKGETKMEQVEVVMEPINWWEHLKRDHAPEWFKKKFPVVSVKRYYNVETQVRFCPHANVVWPDKRHVEWLYFEEPDFRLKER